MDTLRKAKKITLYTMLVYVLLVATHLGEFWPFSIFPMFSKAGNPWTRAMATDVTAVDDSTRTLIWTIDEVESLPGPVFSMRTIGVDQIDYANFVSKTRDWTPQRIQALRDKLGSAAISDKSIMIYKVRGGMTPDNDVKVIATPFLLLTPDTTYFNPLLPRSAYFSEL
jgi:hypothetical protein